MLHGLCYVGSRGLVGVLVSVLRYLHIFVRFYRFVAQQRYLGRGKKVYSRYNIFPVIEADAFYAVPDGRGVEAYRIFDHIGRILLLHIVEDGIFLFLQRFDIAAAQYNGSRGQYVAAVVEAQGVAQGDGLHEAVTVIFGIAQFEVRTRLTGCEAFAESVVDMFDFPCDGIARHEDAPELV